jgi:hypothetical protein
MAFRALLAFFPADPRPGRGGHKTVSGLRSCAGPSHPSPHRTPPLRSFPFFTRRGRFDVLETGAWDPVLVPGQPQYPPLDPTIEAGAWVEDRLPRSDFRDGLGYCVSLDNSRMLSSRALRRHRSVFSSGLDARVCKTAAREVTPVSLSRIGPVSAPSRGTYILPCCSQR